MRWRSVWLTACSSVLALALTGCGGDDGGAEPEVAGPRIERAVADDLAQLSDEVAESLDSGDSCAARESAARLRDGVTEAINAGKVPEVYLEDLSGLANEIEAQIPECVEPAPPPADEDGDDEEEDGRGKGKAKGKNKHEKDD